MRKLISLVIMSISASLFLLIGCQGRVQNINSGSENSGKSGMTDKTHLETVKTLETIDTKEDAGLVKQPDASGIKIFKQSAIRIEQSNIIYIDPYEISESTNDADYIFITHPHYDHFSVNDIAKVIKQGETILVVPEELKAQAEGIGAAEVICTEPGKEYNSSSLSFSTVLAYNTDKTYHPKENSWVGYIIRGEKAVYYIAGDTDDIPEMDNVVADIFIIPIGGTYTMNVEQAAAAMNRVMPKVVIPTHYGDIVGTISDGERFKSMLNNGIACYLLKNN